jgi:hypothetical protein
MKERNKMKKYYKNHVSEEWQLGAKGHASLQFVDVDLDSDNLLFVDPSLIESWDSTLGQSLNKTMNSFFKKFYEAYRSADYNKKVELLSHAREQNSTRLGYGNPGKGNTSSGLIKDFRPLETLIHQVDTIGIPQDLPVLVPGFEEDGFSDLLTNVLHSELNDFTLMQMKKWGVAPNGKTSFYYWEASLEQWQQTTRPCYIYQGLPILLVPKRIVRKKYLFGIGQYLKRVILVRIREEDHWYDSENNPIPKIDIYENIRLAQKRHKNWEYKYSIDYSVAHTDTLVEYHNQLPSFYFDKHMADNELDVLIYGIELPKSA